MLGILARCRKRVFRYFALVPPTAETFTQFLWRVQEPDCVALTLHLRHELGGRTETVDLAGLAAWQLVHRYIIWVAARDRQGIGFLVHQEVREEKFEAPYDLARPEHCRTLDVVQRAVEIAGLLQSITGIEPSIQIEQPLIDAVPGGETAIKLMFHEDCAA